MKKRPSLGFIDIESTGLDPEIHELIEVAVVASEKVIPAHLVTNYIGTGWVAYCSKIRPRHLELADPKALEICAFRPEDWTGAPALCTVIDELESVFARIDAVVGHNVWFDCEMLRRSYQKVGRPPPPFKYRIDTTTLALEHIAPLGGRSLGLAYICDVVGVSNQAAHTALPDALRAKAVYDELSRPGLLKRLRWRWRIQKMKRRS